MNTSNQKKQSNLGKSKAGKKTTQKKQLLLDAFVKKDVFLELVSQANSLIEKRGVVPILSKLLIRAESNQNIHIQATDQSNSLQGNIPARVKTPGELIVDSQSLFDILRELREDEEIHLMEQSEKKIRISQNVSVFNLLGMDAKEFPAFPSFQMKNSFHISSSILKNLLEKTSYCSSLDETRYHLNGVYFETPKDSSGQFSFRFVATDTHRLALAEHSCKQAFLKKGVIISRKGVQELKKLLSYSESESIECAVESPRILFKDRKTVLSIKLVEGTYPNYRQLIPKESPINVYIEKEPFYQALKRASLLSASLFKAVTLNIQKNKISMNAEDSELGSAQDEAPIEKKVGEDLKIRFNARYLLETLNSLDTKIIVLKMCDSSSACLVCTYKKDKVSNVFGVVMPMKI